MRCDQMTSIQRTIYIINQFETANKKKFHKNMNDVDKNVFI